jgi:2'-5' RNA ligase
MRTFIATEIPEVQKINVWEFILSQKKDSLPIKWVAYENLHITLKFIGEIDERKLDSIKSALNTVSSKTKCFKMQLENPGCFPNLRNPRVLWIGVSIGAEHLIKLADELEDSLTQCGIKKEEKKFHPHLTIGRIKAFCKVDNIINKTFATEPFDVKEFILFKSTLLSSGPVYEKIKNFALL